MRGQLTADGIYGAYCDLCVVIATTPRDYNYLLSRWPVKVATRLREHAATLPEEGGQQ